jgi:hypothetical protein
MDIVPGTRWKRRIGWMLAPFLLIAAYLFLIVDGIRIPYSRSADGTRIHYIVVYFDFLLPGLIGRLVVEPANPGGRWFGKQYTFPDGYFEPSVIDFGPEDSPYPLPRIE